MRLSLPAIRPGTAATVIVPVHNEEVRLSACLEALRTQTVSHQLYDVILLLNNCTDSSVEIAEAFRSRHPEFSLYCAVITLAKRQANVGTARRILMDEASRRLPLSGFLLSTDGDTRVAPDWVRRNLNGLSGGADVLGGVIAIDDSEYSGLPETIRNKYEDDAAYQNSCTRLESLLDPDPFDQWPRHYHHYGASLGCTNRLYTKLGGLPPVDCLEDVAFVNAAIRADARVRHSPDVRVWTAARTSGRAAVGFASQLREWESPSEVRVVDSAQFLMRYFNCRAQLRRAWGQQITTGFPVMAGLLGISSDELAEKVLQAQTFGELHDALDLRGTLWRRMKKLERVLPIHSAIEEITALCGAIHPADTALPGNLANAATPGGLENNHAHRLPRQDSHAQSA